MKTQWKDFLESNGAELDDNGTAVSFGNLKRELSVALTGNVFADLSHISVIAAHGSDAQQFLQSQLSNDITAVSASRSQLSSYCTSKGRMLASFRIFKRDDDGFYLSLPATMVDQLLPQLRKFVLMSDVTLEDVSENFIHIGVAGEDAPGELGAILGDAPVEVDDVMHLGECTVIRVPGDRPRFEVYGPIDCAMKLWDALNVRFAPVGQPAWGLLNVMAGVPTIHPQTVETFVPQMANMQLIGGVSFKKGCYPGQEVVARMQYLGKLKRRMYLGHLDADPPAPGTDLFAEDAPEQSAGKIVDAYPHPDGGSMALAVLQIASADSSRIHLGTADGPVFELAALPYPIPEAESA